MPTKSIALAVLLLGCGHPSHPNEVVATSTFDRGRISALAVAGNDVFWSVSHHGDDSCDGAIFQTHIGGATTQLQGGCVPSIVVSGNTVYWTDFQNMGGSFIVGMPVAGGTPQTLASGANFPAVAAAPWGLVASSFDYPSGQWQIIAFDSGTQRVVVTSPTTRPDMLVADANAAYWYTQTQDFSSNRMKFVGPIVKVTSTGQAVTTLVPSASVDAMAVDSTYLYWTDQDITRPQGSLMKIPLAGGAPITLATGLAGPNGLAVVGSYVYWTNAYAGTLMRIPVDAGTPETLAQGLVYLSDGYPGVPPGPVVADDGYVYYADSRQVYRIAR